MNECIINMAYIYIYIRTQWSIYDNSLIINIQTSQLKIIQRNNSPKNEKIQRIIHARNKAFRPRSESIHTIVSSSMPLVYLYTSPAPAIFRSRPCN